MTEFMGIHLSLMADMDAGTKDVFTTLSVRTLARGNDRMSGVQKFAVM